MNKINAYISDDLTHKICKLIQTDGEQRDRLTEGVYLPTDPEQAMGRMERAFKAVKESESIAKKIKKAIRTRDLPKKRIMDLIDLAVEKNIISEDEKQLLVTAEEYRLDAIQVDDFSEEEFVSTSV